MKANVYYSMPTLHMRVAQKEIYRVSAFANQHALVQLLMQISSTSVVLHTSVALQTHRSAFRSIALHRTLNLPYHGLLNTGKANMENRKNL